jgi:hypothetical protein
MPADTGRLMRVWRVARTAWTDRHRAVAGAGESGARADGG